MQSLKLADFEMFWLNGGEFELDGGTMFGVIPKVLWSQKYPVVKAPDGSDNNCIRLLNSPLLVRTSQCLVLIETGLGNKLTEKQKKIYQVTRKWEIPNNLRKLGIKRQDIDYVILTHCDFDHAGGIVMLNDKGGEELTFPNAKHIIQKLEWEDVLQPNSRSEDTYWPQNFLKLDDMDHLQLVEGNYTVCDGIEVEYTGGHTRGHQVVRIQSGREIAYHLADLLPTHVHFNPLWIMAYDNFPMDAISLKEKYEARGIRENAWFTFYHDIFMYACKFDARGRVVKQFPDKAAQKPGAKKKDLPIQNINVRQDMHITISCPDCLLVRDISVGKYIGRKHFLKVKCPCGTIYGVNLNCRKHYRKEISLGGYYTADESDIGWTDAGSIPNAPINCRIKNLSLGGLGFIALNKLRRQVGDTLKVKFTLDKEPPELVEKKVIVRTIRDNYIGCEFVEKSGYTDRTLGFYLMK